MTDARHGPLPVDPARYTLADAAGTIRSAVPRWRHLLEGAPQIPHATTVALAAVTEALSAAGGRGETIAELVAPVHAALMDLAAEVGETTNLLDALGVAHPLVTAVESVDRFLSAAARAVAVDLVQPAGGTLVSVNTSQGGVPKRSVSTAVMGRDGLEGDTQAVRRHHGRPNQALCVWSVEVIEALTREGHALEAGSAGENLTLAGLDWGSLRPGVRMRLGEGADAPVLELTWWTEPCATIAHCFTDGRFRRIDHSVHPGWSRSYAAVVRPGLVRASSPVTVLP